MIIEAILDKMIGNSDFIEKFFQDAAAVSSISETNCNINAAYFFKNQIYLLGKELDFARLYMPILL